MTKTAIASHSAGGRPQWAAALAAAVALALGLLALCAAPAEAAANPWAGLKAYQKSGQQLVPWRVVRQGYDTIPVSGSRKVRWVGQAPSNTLKAVGLPL